MRWEDEAALAGQRLRAFLLGSFPDMAVAEPWLVVVPLTHGHVAVLSLSQDGGLHTLTVGESRELGCVRFEGRGASARWKVIPPSQR
jgi:hypothetical protein